MTPLSILAALLSSLTPVLSLSTSGGGQKPISPKPAPVDGLTNIPPIGLGLWLSPNTTTTTNAVTTALHTGYTHFDSAAAYSNEVFVGYGLSPPLNNLSRSDYWITSKLWNSNHRPSLVRKGIEKTLSELNTTHLDLYLMHWPVAFIPDAPGGRTVIDQDTFLLDTWHAMEDLVRNNLTRYIGISNFSPRQIDQIIKECEICPFAHEFETHPYLQQREFVEWHVENGIEVIAYSPFGNLNPTYDGTHDDLPSILEDEFWVKLAERKGCSVPQAVLAWERQRGTSVIPKSVHAKYIEQNFGSLSVKLTEKEMAQIAEQDKKARFNDPSKGWGVELFEGLDGGSNRFVVEEEVVEEL